MDACGSGLVDIGWIACFAFFGKDRMGWGGVEHGVGRRYWGTKEIGIRWMCEMFWKARRSNCR